MQEMALQHNKPSNFVLHYVGTDVSSWGAQVGVFKQALEVLGGRIDFVAAVAGIGEKKWIPFPEEVMRMGPGEFAKPDLSVLDVDLTGLLWTVALAVQQFRRQEPDAEGWRGKIGVTASVCGFYNVATLPVYTAAKHGVVGFTRSYGRLLPEEGISLNAVCPNIVRTSISTSQFYDAVEREGLLVSMEGVIAAFEKCLEGAESGEVYECGPKGGFVPKQSAGYLDEESRRSMELLTKRARPLHYVGEE